MSHEQVFAVMTDKYGLEEPVHSSKLEAERHAANLRTMAGYCNSSADTPKIKPIPLAP